MALAHTPHYLKTHCKYFKTYSSMIILRNDTTMDSLYGVLSMWARSGLDLGTSNLGKPIWDPPLSQGQDYGASHMTAHRGTHNYGPH